MMNKKIDLAIKRIVNQEVTGKGRKTDPVPKDKNKSYNKFQELLDKSQAKDEDVKLSNHAVKRISERQIDMDGKEFLKLRNAMTKLKSKGSKDSLVITDKGAYIVDVDKNTVVTALEKNSVTDNIFTNIDSTLIID